MLLFIFTTVLYFSDSSTSSREFDLTSTRNDSFISYFSAHASEIKKIFSVLVFNASEEFGLSSSNFKCSSFKQNFTGCICIFYQVDK